MDTPTFTDKLAEIQAVIEQPKFDSTNPAFKSKFASLGECTRVVSEAVRKVGGCAVYQESAYDAEAGSWVMSTRLSVGGEERTLSAVPYVSQDNPQKQGSAITYARRYSICAAFCLVAEEDDDGNAAASPAKRAAKPKAKAKPKAEPDAGALKAAKVDFWHVLLAWAEAHPNQKYADAEEQARHLIEGIQKDPAHVETPERYAHLAQMYRTDFGGASE
jgi:hypothetical protein